MSFGCIQWKKGMIIYAHTIISIIIVSQIVLTYSTNQSAEDNILRPIVSSTTIGISTEDTNYTLLEVKCKDIRYKTEILKTANNFTCENLKPCTDYLVVAKVRDLANQIFNRSYTLTTSYEVPEVILDMVLPNNDSIFLAWNATSPGCISKFNIVALSKDEVIKNILLNNSYKHYEIDGLSPCEEYDLKLDVFDGNSVLVSNVTIKMETSFADPGVIRAVNFSENADHSIRVKWKPSKFASCIKYYYLKWAKLDCLLATPEKCTWTYYNYSNTETNELNITKLDACAQYALAITPNGDHMDNPFLSNFTLSRQSSDVDFDLKVVTENSTTANVTWTLKSNHSECIEKYIVSLCDSDHCISNSTEKTTIRYLNLKPCGSYEVNVTIITKEALNGTSKLEKFMMEEDTPTEVQVERVRDYPKELSITWSTPKFAELCVSHYKVKGFFKRSDENSTNEIKFDQYVNGTTILIKELVSCTKYSIEITPITKAQRKGKAKQFDAETKPTAPDAPDVPEKKLVKGHSIEIFTKDIDQTNRCQVLYARFTCETQEAGKIKYAEEVVPGYLNEFTAVLQPLSPLTTYNCRAWLFNIAGWSVSSSALIATGNYYPEVPDAITATAISNTSIYIKWQQPKLLNGNLVIYKVFIQAVGPKYKIPSHCSPIPLQSFPQTVESQLEYVFKDALPFVQYSVQVAAKNDYGTGAYSDPVLVTTQPWIPDPVENFTVQSIDGPEVALTYNASVTLYWQLPCQANGEIIGFEGFFTGTRQEHEPHQFAWFKNINDPFVEDQKSFQWRESRLKPEYEYIVTIAVIIKGIQEKSDPKHSKFGSPAGIPSKVNITTKGIISTLAAKNPTSSAVLSFSPEILRSDMGTIHYVAVLLSERGCQCDPPLKYDKIPSMLEWPKMPNWQDVQLQDCIGQYQTTPLRWYPFKGQNAGRAINPTYPVEFTIGTEDCSRKSGYCNGPLRPDTSYIAVLRLFTLSGYSDVALLDFKTDTVVHLYFILLLIVTCLLFAFILGFIYLWFTKRIKWHRNSMNGIDESSGDISAKNFLMHYEDLTKREKLQREFKELAVVANDLGLSNSASKSNESKNRYSNIFPYDKNRVILDCDADGSDYINASFINGYKHKKEYIATQGPKPESCIDFWKMILQYNVRAIVMLTQLKEGDIIKCHPYFPQLSKQMKFGHNIEVKCTKEISQELYDKREMVIEHTGDGHIQKVAHYYFRKWPDHDCPTDPTDLITFVRKIKSEKIPSHSPIVIHCSAGVGRTGTYIGLDIIMQRLKSEGKINIFETVKELRFQRMKMVQTIQQYQFLYSCAYQLVKKKFPSKVKDKTITNTSIDEVRLSNNVEPRKRLSFSPNDIESVM